MTDSELQATAMIVEMIERHQRDQRHTLSLTRLYNRAQLAGIALDLSFSQWSRLYRAKRRELGISKRSRFRIYGEDDPLGLSPIDQEHSVDYADLSRDEKAEYNRLGAQRLAIALLTATWADAGKRPSPNKDNSTQAPPMVVKLAQAWLQSPDVTAKYCEIIGIDPDHVAALSLRRHGRPTFTRAELEAYERDRDRD